MGFPGDLLGAASTSGSACVAVIAPLSRHENQGSHHPAFGQALGAG